MSPEEKQTLLRLLRGSRWAALATARDDVPYASWVAVVPEAGLASFLMHLSRLALHTRYLAANPRAALSFSEPDTLPERDPQQLARVSLQGAVTPVTKPSEDYTGARSRYLARLPEAEVQFGLGDFELYRFDVESARYVPGFGRVHRLSPEDLHALVSDN